MASTLLPVFVRQSVYGGFQSISLVVFCDEQSIKARGLAHYANPLPRTDSLATVPQDLILGGITSFSYVKNPKGWLKDSSYIRRLLPAAELKDLFFWGTDEAWFAFHAAASAKGINNPAGFIDQLAKEMNVLSTNVNVGTISKDPTLPEYRWTGMPFLSPSIALVTRDSGSYAVIRLGPETLATNQIVPALVDRVQASTNLIVYDWEFTSPRISGWLYISQLALMLSEHQQLQDSSSALKWVVMAGEILPNGGNAVTEITQTGSHDLSLARRASLGFTSLELFWLANWLESNNFPNANFLTPAPQSVLSPGKP